ncbi:MAG: 3'-5' exoribonuclease [Chloroflexi bacterium]|nr:3'-5' exoribonuclease [Chloroflexota bacterium]
MGEVLVSLDLETTGLDPQSARVIEIGAVRFDGEQIISRFQTFVNPACPLPLSAQRLTGIVLSDLAAAPSIGEALSKLLPFIKGYSLVGHSLRFDLAFLEAGGIKIPNRVYDTFDLAGLLLPETPDFSLATVARVLGVEVTSGHRALADAETSMRVFNCLMARASKLPPGVISECLRLTEGIDWPYRPFFAEIAERRSVLSGGPDPDSVVGWLLPFSSEDKWAKYPPLQANKKVVPIDVEKTGAMLGPGGELTRSFSGFQCRGEQITMAKAVSAAFNEGQHLIVEAGTGTGKSIAYLLPAALFARENQSRVVISSNTINLQEQLIQKDIPSLRECLGWDEEAFRATPLKGRNNYVCLRRWNHFRQAADMSPEETKIFLRTLVWVGATSTGDRAELRLLNSEMRLWGEVCSEEETCLGNKCSYNRRGSCFLYRARKRAEKAHLIITNHALTLSDLAVGNQVIPEYRRLIVDEAHHLEEEATEQFSFAINESLFKDHLNHLSVRTTGKVYSGLLSEIKGRLRRVRPARPQRTGPVETQIDSLQLTAEICQRSSERFFARLAEFMGGQGADEGDFEKRLRLTPSLRKTSGWARVTTDGEPLLKDMKELADGLGKLYSALEGFEDNPFNDYQDMMAELLFRVRNGEELTQRLSSAVFNPENGMIYWGVLERQKAAASLCAAPQHVGELLQKSLFSEKDCVVLTSATLSTDSNFAFVRGRLGLDEARELLIGTPFDYLKSTLLYVVKDMPEPDQPGYQQTLEKLLVESCRATRGKTLVLFTSHRALKRTYEAIKPSLEGESILVLGQGVDGSPKRLLDTFKTNEQSVLLGTSSFWEGVDVVGKALSVLVIARLPFSVPNDPIISARCEEYASPFYEFMVPQSIIRFKQGFGRLIRSHNDRGVVIVADSRIKNRPYGQTFIQSLPQCQLKIEAGRHLVTELRKWLPEETGGDGS